MKKLLFLCSTILLLLFFSCEAPIVFSEPQPQGFDRQVSFDVFYRGTFLCDSDSSIVFVKSKTLYKEKYFPFAIAIEDIATEEGLRLEGNYLYVEELDAHLPARVKGDSAYAELVVRDTLFRVGKDQVLTRYRGHQL
ncbi:MAG: hypothetical protein AAFO94_21640, partial [Bacteroidota bacterium]